MSSKREIAALSAILSDPENQSRTAEEVADLCIDALDDVRARSHRLAVVGQIAIRPQETHTVVLGPFSARGVLDSEEKFLRAVQGGTAAREIGQQLAWDSKTGTGKGRFMLAPAFIKPRDAWNFFRPENKPDLEHITEAVARWQPGLWAEQKPAEPACTCGLKGDLICRSCGIDVTRRCPRHQPGAEIHRCRKAA